MKIDYYILPEVLKEISELDSDTFMKKYNDIEGQFTLKIGSSEIGYVIIWAVGYNFWIEFQRKEDKRYIRFKKPLENHIDYLISSKKQIVLKNWNRKIYLT